MVWYLLLKLSVTEDGLADETGLTIKGLLRNWHFIYTNLLLYLCGVLSGTLVHQDTLKSKLPKNYDFSQSPRENLNSFVGPNLYNDGPAAKPV